MQCAGMAVAPRVSCCRRIEDATLARAENDMDLLFSGYAHGVPRDVGCRRWQSIPVFESNSRVQWAHQYPNACGSFLLTAGMSPLAGRIMKVTDKFCFCAPCLWIYCWHYGYTHLAPATLSTAASRKEQTGIWPIITRDGSFAHLFLRHGRCRILSLRKITMIAWELSTMIA